jgi:hypothetical protein
MSNIVQEVENYMLPLFIRLFGSRIWMIKHLATDWLAGTWFIYWANVLVTFVSVLAFIVACAAGKGEAIFIWLSG